MTTANTSTAHVDLTPLETKFITENILGHHMRDDNHPEDIAIWRNMLDTDDIQPRQVAGLVSSLVQKGVLYSNGEAVGFTELGAALAVQIEAQEE